LPTSTHCNRPHRSTCFNCPSTRCSSSSDSDRHTPQRCPRTAGLCCDSERRSTPIRQLQHTCNLPASLPTFARTAAAEVEWIGASRLASIGKTADLLMQRQCGMRSRTRGVHHQHSGQAATGRQAPRTRLCRLRTCTSVGR
jgi:hypothetical protein